MMSPTELKIWAREEILDAIDAMIAEKIEFADPINFRTEDEIVLKKERDRIAKFLSRPTKYTHGGSFLLNMKQR